MKDVFSRTPAISNQKTITVIQGRVEISNDPTVMLSTILGSCVAVCIWDPQAGIGGMNHFLLSEGGEANEVKYGAHAMEMLINGLLRAGAQRSALKSKAFGGANLSGFGTNIGARNANFARVFLADEGIPCLAESLEGDKPRRVRFCPTSGKAQLLFVRPHEVAPETKPAKQKTEDIILF